MEESDIDINTQGKTCFLIAKDGNNEIIGFHRRAVQIPSRYPFCTPMSLGENDQL